MSSGFRQNNAKLSGESSLCRRVSGFGSRFAAICPELDAVLTVLRGFGVSSSWRKPEAETRLRASALSELRGPGPGPFVSGPPGPACCPTGSTAALGPGAWPRRRPGRGHPPRLGRNRSAPSFSQSASIRCARSKNSMTPCNRSLAWLAALKPFTHLPTPLSYKATGKLFRHQLCDRRPESRNEKQRACCLCRACFFGFTTCPA